MFRQIDNAVAFSAVKLMLRLIVTAVTSLNRGATSAALNTSASTAIASPPAVDDRPSDPFSAFPVGGKFTATRAPAAANAVAIPPPMPLGAPVTIATLSDSLLTIHRCSWSDSSYTQSLMAVNRALPLRKLDFFSLRHERFETEAPIFNFAS